MLRILLFLFLIFLFFIAIFLLFNNKGKYNYFIKSYVKKSNIVFFLNHKNENEVVYLPDSEKIEYVSTDEIEEIPTINSPRNKRIAKGEL